MMLLVILMIGLKPGDISPQNHASWLPDRTGLHFETYGIAYADSISDLVASHITPGKAFSIELAYRAKEYQADGFHFILLLHGGQDEKQLLVGQWRSSLIVMNGDDYAHRKRTERITATPPDDDQDMQFVTVTSGSDGTSIFFNGKMAARKTGFQLEVPESKITRLLIGNSVYGNHSWEGDIYGMALFGRTLSEEEVATHYDEWLKGENFSFLKKDTPTILYTLDGDGENQAVGTANESHDLQVPPRMKILSPAFFFQKWNIQRIKHILGDKDAWLNFFGFVPLGFLMVATFSRLGGRFGTHALPIALLSGFLVSLWIETVQAWMPARSSDMQDLILNTAGTLAGALAFKYLLRGKEKHEEREVGR